MRKGFISNLLLITIGAGSGIATAQTDPLIFLDDVVVMENRLRVPLSRKPAPILVIDAETIKNIPAQSLASILQSVPGVDIRRRGADGIQADAGIRGSTFDQVLILVNGIRISDSQTGHHNLNIPVDPDMIERIEIHKGSSARVFGQNAFAGAINIITKSSIGNSATVRLTTGQPGYLNAGAALSLNTRTTKNHLAASHSRSEGYTYNTDYRLTNILYQGDVMTGAGTLSYTAGVSDRGFGANGFYSGPLFPDQYEEITTAMLSANFTPNTGNESLEMSARMWFRHNHDDYVLRRDDPGFYRNIHSNNTAGADFNITRYGRTGTLGAGAEFSYSAIVSTRLGNHNRAGFAGYADYRLLLFGDKLSLTPGIHLNHSTGFGTSLLPGIDIGYGVSSNLLAFLNTGYTLRVPTFTDLWYHDPGNEGNPELKPEYALSTEVGIKTVRMKSLHATFSLFNRTGTNIIDRIRESETDKWKPENIHNVKYRGVEGHLTIFPKTLTGLQTQPLSRLTLGFAVTGSEITGILPAFSRFRLDNLRRQFTGETELTFLKRFSHTLNVRYSERFTGETYLVADTRLTFSAHRLRLFAEMHNITGERYYETWQVFMPGRTIRAGISFKFPG